MKLGSILFEAVLFDDIAPTTIVQIAMSLFYFIFPLDNLIVRKCFSKVEEVYANLDYEKSCDEFETVKKIF